MSIGSHSLRDPARFTPDALLLARPAELIALDEATVHFEQGRWREGMQIQHRVVCEARRNLPAEVWRNFARKDCLTHPVKEFVHQDPFTRRSFLKPRGYAGDAVLIDYIYGIDHPEHEIDEATPLGRWAYNFNLNASAPRAVRNRKRVVAELIDRICADRPHARILSLAGGHMRELQTSHAVRAGLYGEIVAFDQDTASLEEVGRAAKSKSIRAVQGSISRLIVGQSGFSDFDLVYTTGLFDYLDDRAARRLAATMFEMLKPGGTLLIANFLPDTYDIGYMESFMGWDLIYRDRAQITALSAGIRSAIEAEEYFEEPERNIGFLRVKKALKPRVSPDLQSA